MERVKRKGLKAIVLVLLLTAYCLLLAALPAQAAGTVTVTLYNESRDKDAITIKLACTGDAANGSVPATAVTDAAIFAYLKSDYTKLGYYLYEVKAVAGDPAPDAADIAITDAAGATLFTEASVIPASGASYGVISAYRAVTSALTVTVTNQTTVSAKWDIYITLVK